jgi:hypothetical protein
MHGYALPLKHPLPPGSEVKTIAGDYCGVCLFDRRSQPQAFYPGPKQQILQLL